ncbi:ABC transporter substrate-binding protein [Tepidanaerobacter syntrophicus]|uniref:ABC transporter substrate-binding protein n=1 Tax=Tepidanaerobacter syntrophicus TaxID=224999 RepID=UPI0022EFC105|nr:ABC transporter substrate-binding protein [Tepidanaerobacter syntrophicus]GLI19307.1 ABC transporter substrate-binding protein [Tepidanaerobacter syntrophicus]
MKKTFITSIVIMILILALALIQTGCGSGPASQESTSDTSNSEDTSAGGTGKVYKIGISQFVEHPALDSAREGFVDGLKEAGFEEGKNIEIIVENAQADFSTTQAIANKLINEKVDLILAIATPSAQAAVNATKDISILVTAVTDPVDAGLVKSMEKPGTNVTGTTDMNPVKDQLKLLKEIIPSAKNVGIIYNAAEPNSVVQVNIAKEAAKELDLTIFEATVANTSEINQAVQSLVSKVDAIYTPTDNTVASAISNIVKVANEAKIPVIGAERGEVEGGALATIGIDYYLLGKQTGQMAARVLNGENPAEMPIESSKDLKLIINKKSAEALGITIPQEVLSRADEILEK